MLHKVEIKEYCLGTISETTNPVFNPFLLRIKSVIMGPSIIVCFEFFTRFVIVRQDSKYKYVFEYYIQYYTKTYVVHDDALAFCF